MCVPRPESAAHMSLALASSNYSSPCEKFEQLGKPDVGDATCGSCTWDRLLFLLLGQSS